MNTANTSSNRVKYAKENQEFPRFQDQFEKTNYLAQALTYGFSFFKREIQRLIENLLLFLMHKEKHKEKCKEQTRRKNKHTKHTKHKNTHNTVG